jgi:phage terminase large subunit GpA-like protein
VTACPEPFLRGKFLEQLTGEKKITVRDKRTRTKPVPSGLCEGKVLYVKTYSRNEALDLTVYCHAGLFALKHFIAPAIYRDLGKLAETVAKGQSPETLGARVRRVRSPGLG